jgi:nitroimidazol reductase NimA-like FMN-containing flavoprotein (pyridoxamine 5'-phosphate oxidase superfamily)
MVDPADPDKRRLTREESVELLSRPLVGVFSSLSKGGWIHSVPVHFLYAGEQVRLLAGTQDVKTRNVERTGHATLCVEVTEGSARSYVSVSGPATVQRPPATADLQALDERYARNDFAGGWEPDAFADAVLVVLSIDRWIAWTDWD